MSEDSLLPGDDIELGLQLFPETRAGGGYDRRRTGGDMTNGKAMNAMMNFSEVSKGLLGMYDPGTEEHTWLVEETAKWGRLTKALYKVSCFFKSQERRCPKECDDLLYELWWAWYYAFPGMEFNKFHGLFCGMRNFVHKFESAGRFSEEACESYMAVIEKLKNMLRGMSQTEKRCQLI